MKNEDKLLNGIIYHAFDTSNGKAWVGQTTMTLEKRRYFHSRKWSSCRVLRNAILKRPEAFVWTVLVSGLTNQDDLNAAEDAFIVELDTLVPNGYNLKRGGSKGKNSPEMNEKISIGMKGKNTWSKGRKQSPESIVKRTQTTKERGHTGKGIPKSDEARANMRAGWKARKERLNG